ncbi:uncharacterized protein N7483_006508 [Penicillium malachiteum]|uniref:uncharacterized protein n=1 Tax=Penicillium malachiteum TaxID=1324776 RepID=UPI0025472062|nr:uncharacterized protein N7483_006508 [Penicillium malachiteum]KAJ5725151.1 hypothetical protein N7483_006508 [Penicillium malachiteum]
MLHLSFRDVLLDQTAPDMTDFRVDKTRRNYILAMRCIEVMSSKESGLRYNMLCLENDGVPRSEIDATKVNLAPHLRYACRYWLQHLQDGSSSLDQDRIYEIFKIHLLHWLENIGYLDIISEALRHLICLERKISGTNSTKLGVYLSDAIRFVRRAGETISNARLQVYSSALIFTPQNSVIRQIFNSQIPKCFITLPQVIDEWDALLQTSESRAHCVDDLVFLPDGRLLASTHGFNMTMIWNVEGTGAEKQIKNQPSPSRRGLTSVISPNGKFIACVFLNGVIQIWHVDSPDLVKFLPATDNPEDFDYDYTREGPDAWAIRRIAFSFNSQVLATATEKQIQLWSVTEKDPHLLHTFCEKDLVQSIEFLNGDCHFYCSTHEKVKVYRVENHGISCQRLAVSMEQDHNKYAIRVYDSDVTTTELGMPIKTVIAHSGNSNEKLAAINLSPDGRWLLCTLMSILKLWDLDNEVPELAQWGRAQEKQRVFHTSAFSLDGRLACGLRDSVQIWEIDKLASDDAWQISKSLPIINGIRISPDGQKLALSILRKELQIWDIGGVRKPQTHTYIITDGQVLAFSPMRDESISLWDLKHRMIIRKLTLGADRHNFCEVICFSSDSQMLLGAVSAGEGGHLVWDLSKETCDPFKYFERSPKDWDYWPLAIALSPQNRYLVASHTGEDDIIIVWDFVTCEIVRTTIVPGPVMILEFSEEGNEIIMERGVFSLIEPDLESDESSTGAIRQYSLPLDVRDDWIVTGDQKRLWLTHEERGVWASHREALYIGTKSGRLQKYVVRDDGVRAIL